MPTFHGLYYPYIHFRDDGWLKGAALYWDEMSRIVPAGTSLHDSDDVRRLSDAGFVHDKTPQDGARKIAESFRRLLHLHGETLQQRFDIASMPEAERAEIFDEKMDWELVKDLDQFKLIKRRRDRWIGMHPTLANVYMTALAEAMAPDIGARPVADQTRDHLAVSGLTFERLTDLLLSAEQERGLPLGKEQEVEEAMATIALRSVLPANPSSIPIEQIISFRETYKEERGLFQVEVGKIIKELDHVTHMTNQNEIQRHLQSEYDKRLAGKVDRLGQAMRKANWSVVDSAIAASCALPAGLAAGLAAMGLALPAAAAGVAGVAYAGWSILRKRRDTIDQTLKPSAEAYLYRAKAIASPKALAEDIYNKSKALNLNQAA